MMLRHLGEPAARRPGRGCRPGHARGGHGRPPRTSSARPAATSTRPPRRPASPTRSSPTWAAGAGDAQGPPRRAPRPRRPRRLPALVVRSRALRRDRAPDGRPGHLHRDRRRSRPPRARARGRGRGRPVRAPLHREPGHQGLPVGRPVVRRRAPAPGPLPDPRWRSRADADLLDLQGEVAVRQPGWTHVEKLHVFDGARRLHQGAGA